jgi:hypothetical protein
MQRAAAITALSLCLALPLAGCQQSPTTDNPVADQLTPVEHTGFDLAKADPAVNLASYNTIIVEPLGFSRLDIVEPSTTPGRYHPFSLDERDMASLRELYQRQVNLALGADGRYAIATEAGAGTLRLVSDLVKLEPKAPREEDRRFGGSARDDIYTEGAGSLTLEAQLIDSVTGKTVMLLRNRLRDTEIWGPNNVVTNRAAVSRAFTRWANQLRRQLERAGN